MKNLYYFLVSIFLVLSYTTQGQDLESAAQGDEIDFLLEAEQEEARLLSTSSNSKIINQTFTSHKPTQVESKLVEVDSKKAGKQESKREKKIRRLDKFLNSGIGKLITRLAAKKAVNKKYRKAWKESKGDREKRQILKEKKKQEAKALSQNMRIGLILILVGIILSLILDSDLYILGTLAIVAGIIFIILDLI